jgi:peptidoglycan-associated lipoprotein
MRKIVLLLMLGLIAAFMTTGCAKKAAKEDTGMGMEEESAMAGTETVTEEQRMARMGEEAISGKYIEDSAMTARFNDIYFDFDMYNIKDDAKPTLRELADWLSQNNAKVIVEGHCDERGTNEYNLGLGDRRANSTKQYLVASGVSTNKVETISYGEEKPQCTEKTSSCWSKNRRAHFVVLLPR